MKNIFFDPIYHNATQTLINVLALLLISALLIHLIYILFARILYRNSRQRQELKIRLSKLWSIVAYFVLFNVYLGFFFYFLGIDFVRPSALYFYLGILAQLLGYLSIIIYFFLHRRSFNRTIHNPSLN